MSGLHIYKERPNKHMDYFKQSHEEAVNMTGGLVEVAGDSARGGFWLFLGEFASTAFLAVGSILVARLLGPSDYGVYSLALVVPSILASMIGLGIDQAVVRFPAKYKAENKLTHIIRILKAALAFKLLMGMGASIICFLLADFWATHLLSNPGVSPYIRIASALVLLQALLSMMYSAFIGLDRAEAASITKTLMTLVKASLAPILIILGLGVAGAVAGHVAGYAVASLAGAAMLISGQLKSLKQPSEKHEKQSLNGFGESLKLMLIYGLPLFLASLILLLCGQLQLIILANIVPTSEIGNYSAAANLTSLLTVTAVPVSTALFPAFSKLNPHSQELKNFFSLSVKYFSLLIMPTCMAVILLSGNLVSFFYGEAYQSAALYLALSSILYLFTGLGYGVTGNLLNGTGETKLALKAYIAYLAIFIAAAPVLTWLWGVPGMIAANLTANLILTLYSLHLANRKFNTKINLGGQARIFIASALSLLPTLAFLRLSPLPSLPNLLIGAALYLLAYLTLTPILKAIDMQDLQNIKQILTRIKIIWPMAKLIINYEQKMLQMQTPNQPAHA